MKIPLGFMLGFVAGAYTWSKLTEEQRAGFSEKVDRLATTGRTGKIAQTFRSGVGDVADVATERITDVSETVTGAATSAISSDDTTSAQYASGSN